MNETINSRVKKLEVGREPADEPIRFRVFGVSALPDGNYERVNLKSGNRKIMRAEQLGIEPYTPRECPPPRVVGQVASQDTLAVPIVEPEPVQVLEEGEGERVERIRAQIERDFK